VPRKLLQSVAGLLSQAANVMFPYTSELNANHKKEEIKRVYVNGSKFLAGVSIPLYLSIILFSKHILSIWITADFAQQAWRIVVFMAFMKLIGSLTIIPNNVLIGLGYTKLKSYFSIANILLYAFFIPLSASNFGINGVVVAQLFVAILLGVTFIFYFNSKIANLEFREYFRRVYLIHLPFFIFVLLTFYISNRLQTTPWLILAQVGFLLFYGACMVLSKWIPIQALIDSVRPNTLIKNEN
jgi:O-antigen/teichoic acid export membrane protein